MNSPTKHQTAPRECCPEHGCESGLRNNYFAGKRLTADSFRVEQKYLLERRWLLNRAIHGWGVVYGYAIESEPESGKKAGRNKLKIGAGLALDKCGRELLQTETPIDIAELIILDEQGNHIDIESVSGQTRRYSHQKPDRECWLLSVHYAEKYTGPVTVEDACRCEHHEWDNTCETVRYSLQRVPCSKCCVDFDCDLHCKCGTGKCCEESKRADDTESDDTNRRCEEGLPHKRVGCRCICDHLTNLSVGSECDSLCEIEEPCGRVRVDLRNGAPLACVDLIRDDCDRWTFGEVEACGPRRLVKRNDLLFDLIRGCDLTRIIRFGWSDWHRHEDPVSFPDFSDAFGPEGEREDEYLTNLFWVEFSRPVRRETLRPDCFAMTIMAVEREGGWWQTFRVPVVRIDTTKVSPQPDDPNDCVRSARLVVDGSWIEDGVRGRRSLFNSGETWVEIEFRGDLVVDCNDQTIDVNSHGLSTDTTGNGTPGGTLFSSFKVAAAREAPSRPVTY